MIMLKRLSFINRPYQAIILTFCFQANVHPRRSQYVPTRQTLTTATLRTWSKFYHVFLKQMFQKARPFYKQIHFLFLVKRSILSTKSSQKVGEFDLRSMRQRQDSGLSYMDSLTVKRLPVPARVSETCSKYESCFQPSISSTLNAQIFRTNF